MPKNPAQNFRDLSNAQRLEIAAHGFYGDLQVGDVELAPNGRVVGVITKIAVTSKNTVRIESGSVVSYSHTLEAVRFIRP